MVVRFRDTGGLTSVGKVLMPETNTKTDAELVVAAAGGDDSAFADLYELYFDRVYDFVRRMVRDADDAADVAQDAFVKAMGGIAKLKDASSFKTWIFSIARNTALNRIEQSGRVVHDREDEEGDSLLYRQVDTNALDNPEQAADANEMAALVWEAASSLEPKQYAVLDMTVRQEMGSAEIADVLKVSKGNAYTMVSRVKDAMEEAVTALFMTRQGSKDCPTLEALIEQMSGGALSADSRRVVMKHVKSCEICEERRKNVISPVALFGAFAPFPAAAEVKASVRGAAEKAWRGSLAEAGAGTGGGLMGSFTAVELALGGLAVLTILVVSGFLTALSLGGSSDDDSNVAAVSATDDEEEDAAETGKPSPTATETATPTATPGVLPPGGPAEGNAPPGSPAPPQLAPAQLAVDFSSITFDGPGSVTLHLSNQGGQSLDWTLSGVPGWLTVSPTGGTIPAGGSADLSITLPEGALGPGAYGTTLAIGSGGGDLNIAVSASIAAPVAPPDTTPPQLQGRVSCALGQGAWMATGAAQASDPSGIESVTMTVDSFGSTAMTASGSSYSATLTRQTTPPATVRWSITAIDSAGNETTISGSDSCI
jgi:RNA polymerase sigma factor (sigma-70 family)